MMEAYRLVTKKVSRLNASSAYTPLIYGLSTDSSSDEDEEQDDEEIEDEALAQSEGEDEDEPIPLESVLENPIYSLAEQEEQEEQEIASEADETKDKEEEEADSNQGPMGCMLCPNKLLKNEKMAEVHLNSKPHKRSAARFAKKIEDPAFDRSQVIDPRDISIQIEEEIRASKNSNATPQEKQATNKSRPVPSKSADSAQATEVSEVKPKRQRAWKEARKEAKRRRVEAKETGQPPRKQLEREEKLQERAKPNKSGDNPREISAVPKKGSKKVTKQEGRKSKVSEASKPRS
ncbi:hypothetical protein QFC19_003951 [Naganishia cerealis]|uniref:Uncharacterized protein n=1 Tax=Naganishia cerealis TaxID=610337 RepID=A0ACC2W0G4_9TREE|nr:hypothetical protein QFC19_003951 [Naganishia cerealis]